MEKTFRSGSIREMEELMIMHRLGENEQNRTHSARTLQISVRTLRNKLREYRERDKEPAGVH
jgi:two-component system response regulator FlrC